MVNVGTGNGQQLRRAQQEGGYEVVVAVDVPCGELSRVGSNGGSSARLPLLSKLASLLRGAAAGRKTVASLRTLRRSEPSVYAQCNIRRFLGWVYRPADCGQLPANLN